MLVKEARALARELVLAEAADLPEFHSAYLAGSAGWLPDDDVLPPTSDLDINVVFTGPNVPDRREKLLAFHETLLELLGCDHMSRTQVEEHFSALTEVFDAATGVIRSPFHFASDISQMARPLAIDGSRELIERGLHHEAVFWIAATYSRCRTVLTRDAPGLLPRFDPGYRALLADLGITSFADIQRRSEQVREHLPRVWEVAETIMALNPEIKD